jgi:hypothetical protein
MFEDMRKEMYDVTYDYTQLSNPPLYNLLNNSFAGSGKSYLTCKAMEDADAFFIYLVHEHDVGSDQMNKNKVLFNLTQIKSRNKLCKHESYKLLAQKGINIKQFCPECSYMGVCEYYQRMIEIWKEPQSWIGVHHHLGGLVNNYVEENLDVIDAVVIDEYFLQGIWNSHRIFWQTLMSTINLLTLMDETNERTFILDVLKEFVLTFRTNKLNTSFIHERIYKYFRLYGTPFDLRMFYNEYESRLAQQYFDTGKIFLNIVTPLVKCLKELYKTLKPVKDPTHLDYINNVMKFKKGTFKGKVKYFIDISYVDLDAIDLPCKVIILDATTPPAFYEKIFNRRIKTLQNKTVVNSKIYQLSSWKYVMTTLDREDSDAFNRLLNIVKNTLKKHDQEMLVVSRKKYEDRIKAINPDLIQTAHYPLFGRNDFEHINVVVLFGTPEPKRDVLKRKANLLGIEIRANIKEEPTYIYILSNVDLDLTNAVKLPIGKLERLIQNKIVGYVSEENEQRIADDFISYLKIVELPLSELTGLVTGNSVVKNEVLKRLEQQNIVEIYKKNVTGRGRKPSICRLLISDQLRKI